MAEKTALILWTFMFFLAYSSAQQLYPNITNTTSKICQDINCHNCALKALAESLEGCVVIFGNLRMMLLEQAHTEDYVNMKFPMLREVTGYVAFYRVQGLQSIGNLFPNLARIRGRQVLYNYALIIYDMGDLRDVGLFSLLKIDRGGVIVWAVPHACFVHTINWKLIAPNYRHILNPVENNLHCMSHCSCTDNVATNNCWNVMKCQRYAEGVEGYTRCDEQCLGCSRGNGTVCLTCRYYTYLDQCVSECPNDTLVLSQNDYCISSAECSAMSGWAWNGSCVFNCTIGYKKEIHKNGPVCVPCDKCEETCGNLLIQTLGNIEEAGRCVHVKGYLVIHIRSLLKAMDELKTFLGRIQDVSDYVVIHGSRTITSLEFLSSLRWIGGRNLRNGSHSLIIYDMSSLQSLFTENVTKTLKVDKGSLYVYNNPLLCTSELDKIQDKFPTKLGPLDLTQGTNGYSGGCTNASIGLEVNVINETSVLVNFTHVKHPQAHYSILYVRLPQGSRKVFVPETCSDSEWHAYNIPFHLDTKRDVILTNLRPASSYALCIEKYDPESKDLARSNIFNFTTPVGKPEPPFILELVASSSSVVVLRWVDHKMYRSHIKRYELDVTLVDIYERDIKARDHCVKSEESYEEIDFFRHAVVMRPPPDYDRGCESMCGVLSTVTAGAMVEDHLDICSSIVCNVTEADPPKNTSFGKFVRTLSLNISGPRNDFQVGVLAPFRDYRFRLRACGADECSRYARGVVRTLRSEYADVPIITYVSAAESGYISIKWEPPELTNGAILSYTVAVLPSIKQEEPVQLMPQVWCQPSDTTSVVVRSVAAKKYLVNVCSTSLGSRKACSERKKVISVSEVIYVTWWWVGILFGILIYSMSLAAGIMWKKRRDYSYGLPLLDHMDVCEGGVPDFIYTIPLSEIQLN